MKKFVKYLLSLITIFSLTSCYSLQSWWIGIKDDAPATYTILYLIWLIWFAVTVIAAWCEFFLKEYNWHYNIKINKMEKVHVGGVTDARMLFVWLIGITLLCVIMYYVWYLLLGAKHYNLLIKALSFIGISGGYIWGYYKFVDTALGEKVINAIKFISYVLCAIDLLVGIVKICINLWNTY